MGRKRYVKELEAKIRSLHGGLQHESLTPEIREAIQECRIGLLLHYGYRGRIALVTDPTPVIIVNNHVLPGPFDLKCAACGRADGKLHQQCEADLKSIPERICNSIQLLLLPSKGQ